MLSVLWLKPSGLTFPHFFWVMLLALRSVDHSECVRDRAEVDAGSEMAGTSHVTRHVVFQWNPRAMFVGWSVMGARVRQVYEHVSFVFQLPHQDENLAASDLEKYMTWLLQPAW